MPRLTDEMIFARIRKAMMPQAEPTGQGASPQALDSLIQKAKAKRGETPIPGRKVRGLR